MSPAMSPLGKPHLKGRITVQQIQVVTWVTGNSGFFTDYIALACNPKFSVTYVTGRSSDVGKSGIGRRKLDGDMASASMSSSGHTVTD